MQIFAAHYYCDTEIDEYPFPLPLLFSTKLKSVYYLDRSDGDSTVLVIALVALLVPHRNPIECEMRER